MSLRSIVPFALTRTIAWQATWLSLVGAAHTRLAWVPILSWMGLADAPVVPATSVAPGL